MSSILLKWRENAGQVFQNYTEVPTTNIRNYIGPVYPYQSKHVGFRVEKKLPEALRTPGGAENEIFLLRISDHFYLIEPNIFLVFNPDFPVALLDRQNITEYTVGSNNWKSVKEIQYPFYQLCFVSLNPSAFATIGGQNALAEFTSKEEIGSNGLNPKSMDELLRSLKVPNYIFW